MSGVTVLAGLIILVGLIGIVMPVLPGLPLVWAALLVWALVAHRPAGWVVLGVATVMAVSGRLLQYILPGRQLAKAGVSTSSTMAGAALGALGFFVLPVVGALLGFPLGIYLAERLRLGAHAGAWQATKQSLRALGLGMAIELLTAVTMITTWVIGVAAIA